MRILSQRLPWDADALVLIDDPTKGVLEYIAKHFDQIVPFEVYKTYEFQIRVARTEMHKLSYDGLQTLKKHAEPLTSNSSFQEDRSVPDWQYFWKHCDCYIFNITSHQAVMLHRNCVYGYEGREISNSLLFFPNKEFPPVIVQHIGTKETEPWIETTSEDKYVLRLVDGKIKSFIETL